MSISATAPTQAPSLTQNLKTVGVVGAGAMGNGIAGVRHGRVQRPSAGHLPGGARARGQVDRHGLDKFVEKNRITAADRDAALERVTTGTTLDPLAEVDYVVEAAIEHVETKRALFASLDAVTRPNVILSSNKSSISITTLGAATRRPDRVLGMHFMNPVPLMTLVELIRGQATSSDAMAVAAELCVRLGKTGIEAADYPGFIANRILMPMLNEAMFAVMEGVGTPEAINRLKVLRGSISYVTKSLYRRRSNHTI